MLAIARALVGHPHLLMLDEPSQGLAPRLVRDLQTLLLRLKDEGVTILLVEQNARMALRVAHRGYVIQTGRIVLQDAASALLHSDVVRKAYLGEK
jgi:branched-chain amino acid transport system ATP-binding protein